MSDDRVRQLVKGLGDGVVPLADEPTAAAARARALPRIEASLRGVAASNVRRSRTRRVAVAIGIAAALALGAASAAMLTRASVTGAADPLRGPSTVAPPPVTGARFGQPNLGRSDPVSAPVAIASPAPEIPSASPEAPAAPQAASAPAPPRAVAARAGASSEVSTLSDQNRLFASALDARRRNDDARAIGLLNELLRKYPSSPLAQEARVERLRCLERLGQRGAAADEARRYLADYPDGFAREEAKGQVMPTPSGRANKP